MPVKLKSTQVQQNFGLVMDRALIEDDVIVERYGVPHVAIIEYSRYQKLVETEKSICSLACLQQASTAASARAAHLTEEEVETLIEQARGEVHQETTTPISQHLTTTSKP